MSLSSQASPVSYAEYRTQLETLLRTNTDAQSEAYRNTVIGSSLNAARLLLAYSYGLAHDELLDSTLQAIDERAAALLDDLDDDEESALDRATLRQKYEGKTWSWIEGVYEEDNSDKPSLPSSSSSAQLSEVASRSAALFDLISQGRHIRPSLHPFNLFRFVFHNLDSSITTGLLRLLRTSHLQQTQKLLSFGAPFASPQWCLVTALHPEVQRAELEALCAHLLERAHADSTSVRARFRLVSQALALAPPNQLRALLPQWTLVSREVEEALQGADPYEDAATAAANAAHGFGAGLGLGQLPSIDIRDLSAGVRSWSASVGRMVSGVWR
ncbi:hypothetical protein CF319_g2522 [Tilletia indica]|nr:hypothetical protein CF319_g2522 [Tilletia indica]